MSAFTPPLSQFAFAVKVRSPTILDTVTGAVDVDAEGGLGTDLLYPPRQLQSKYGTTQS